MNTVGGDSLVAGFVPSFGGSGSAKKGTTQARIDEWIKDREYSSFSDDISRFWENQKRGWSEGLAPSRMELDLPAATALPPKTPQVAAATAQARRRFRPERPGSSSLGFGGAEDADELEGMGSFRQYQEMQRRQEERAKMMEFAPGALDLEGMEPPTDEFVSSG